MHLSLASGRISLIIRIGPKQVGALWCIQDSRLLIRIMFISLLFFLIIIPRGTGAFGEFKLVLKNGSTYHNYSSRFAYLEEDGFLLGTSRFMFVPIILLLCFSR